MSVLNNVLAAVKTSLQSISSLSTFGITQRKRPYFDAEGGDTLPLVVISPGEPSSQMFSWPRWALVSYPVVVTIYYSQESIGGEVDTITTVREDIKKKLYGTGITVVNTYDWDYEDEPIYTMEGLDAHIDVSLQLFTYKIIEDAS